MNLTEPPQDFQAQPAPSGQAEETSPVTGSSSLEVWHSDTEEYDESGVLNHLDSESEESESQQADLNQADPELYFEDLAQVLTRFRKLVHEGAFLKNPSLFYQYKNRFHQLFDQAREQAEEKFQQNRSEEDDAFEYTPTAEEKEARKLLERAESELREAKKRRERELQENLLKKEDILDEMRLTLQNLPVQEAIKKMGELRQRWRETGPVPASKSEEIWKNYQHWNQMFTQLLERDKELFEEELRKNLAEKEKIILGLETLLQMPSALKAVQFIQPYRKKWAETGPVPKEKSKELFERFKSVLDKIYSRRNEELQKLREIWQKNKEAKEALVLKAMEVAERPIENYAQYKDALAQLNELMHQWKQVGRTSFEDTESLWNRFSEPRKLVNKKWQDWRRKRNYEFRKNAEEKEKIIQEAQQLLSPDNWKEATQHMLKLQEKWKNIGPAGKERSEELWKKFREIQDAFFQKKKAFFDEIPKIYQKNKEAKEALISRIENFEVPEGFHYDQALQEVKSWRQEFSQIGHVPLADKASLEERFNEVVDRFLARFQADRKKAERDSFRVKIQEMQENGAVDTDKLKAEVRGLRQKIEKLRAEMNQLENNLKFFQFAKNAEALKKPYEQKLGQVKEQIEVQEARLHTLQLALKKAGVKG
ncbi:MAG: DUF349 domain-containing protein [Flavobacteriales bacterium]|nr:DUF349 domain-containing protein [Flavobacteriales bacterium]MCX7650291.1 DUF349 domain-containing protein [Flavobacteriales bacterium]MDW8431925.1 DUF349 domain-containing protein [Flavobacteriales bacterium]